MFDIEDHVYQTWLNICKVDSVAACRRAEALGWDDKAGSLNDKVFFGKASIIQEVVQKLSVMAAAHMAANNQTLQEQHHAND